MLLRRRRACPIPNETDRVRRIFDKQAPKYDRSMARFERLLVSANRERVSSQARGEVLEFAAGTARNLRHYPIDAKITGVELRAVLPVCFGLPANCDHWTSASPACTSQSLHR